MKQNAIEIKKKIKKWSDTNRLWWNKVQWNRPKFARIILTEISKSGNEIKRKDRRYNWWNETLKRNKISHQSENSKREWDDVRCRLWPKMGCCLLKSCKWQDFSQNKAANTWGSRCPWSPECHFWADPETLGEWGFFPLPFAQVSSSRQ